jgi:TonB family protein
MKFCPTCQTRYDEEILRFCTKDGTLLIEESQPNFTALPSQSGFPDDDSGEETVIRRKAPTLPPDFNEKQPSAPRIIIPTGEEKRDQTVRTRPPAYQPPPPKSNTLKVVLLTVLGTVVILGGIVAAFRLLQTDKPVGTNTNVNVSNVNTNPPTNLNIGNPFNINLNTNANTNINANVNRSPTPKPSPTPTASPRPTPNANANAATNTNSAVPPVNPTPSPTVTPRPAETPSAPPSNRPVNVGVLNGRAVNLPTPAYPQQARDLRASGRVTVQVFVDASGNVSSAKAVSGHPLLRQAAEAAARQSRFNPILVNNQAVAATGVLVYNFVN